MKKNSNLIQYINPEKPYIDPQSKILEQMRSGFPLTEDPDIKISSDDYFLLALNKLNKRITFDANQYGITDFGVAQISNDLKKTTRFNIAKDDAVSGHFPYIKIKQAEAKSSYNSVALVRDEMGRFVPYKINVFRNEQGKDVITGITERINAPISFRGKIPFIPGQKMSIAKTHGLTNTVDTSNTFETLKLLHAYVNTTRLNQPENADKQLEALSKLHSGTQVSLDVSSAVNFENMFHVKDLKYDLAPDGYKYKNYALSVGFTEMNNMFFNNDFTNKNPFYHTISTNLGKDVTGDTLDFLKNSNFIFEIGLNNKGATEISNFKIFNKSTKMIADGGLKSQMMNLLKDYRIGTANLTIEASRHDLTLRSYIPYQSYINPNDHLNVLERFNKATIDSNLFTSFEHDPESISKVFSYIYSPQFNNDTNEILVPINSKFNQKIYKDKAMEFKQSLNVFMAEIANEFIRKENIQEFSGMKMGTINPVAYLDSVIGSGNLSGGQLKRVQDFRLTLSENSIISQIITGNKFFKASYINKQSNNKAGEFNFLEIPYGPLSHLDTSSQRKSQAKDAIGSFSTPSGTDFNREIGKVFANFDGYKYTGRTVSYDNFNKVQEVLLQELKQNNVQDLNGFIPGSAQSTRTKMLLTTSPLTWQDSYLLSNTAKMRMINADDKLANISIKPEQIAFKKITKFGTNELYDNFEEFVSDFEKLKNSSVSDFIDENTFAGHMLKSIAGNNYERIVNQSSGIDNIFSSFLEPYKLLSMSNLNREEQVRIINEMSKQLPEFMRTNFMEMKKGSGSILDKNMVGSSADIRSTNFGFVENISFDNGSLNFGVRKIRTGGNGSKFLVDAWKGTINTTTVDTLYAETEIDGRTYSIPIDGLFNAKTGSAKRGFGGSYFSSAITSMVERIEDSEFISGINAEQRFNQFYNEFLSKDFLALKGVDNQTINISPLDFFGLNINRTNGNFNVSSVHTKEAMDLWIRQFQKDKDFPNYSLQEITRSLFNQNLRDRGINISTDEEILYGAKIIRQMKDQYESFIKANVSPDSYGDAAVFVSQQNSKIIGSIYNNGKVTFTPIQTLNEGIAIGDKDNIEYPDIILNYNLRHMRDSVTQKTSGSLSSKITSQNIFSKLGFDELNTVIREKAVRENIDMLDAITDLNNPIDLRIRDYITVAIDGSTGNISNRKLEKGITLDEYRKGNFLFSDVLRQDNLIGGRTKPIMINITGLDNDKMSKIKGIISNQSTEAQTIFSKLGSDLLSDITGRRVDFEASSKLLTELGNISQRALSSNLNTSALEDEIAKAIIKSQNYAGVNFSSDEINKIKLALQQNLSLKDSSAFYNRLGIIGASVETSQSNLEKIRRLSNIELDGYKAIYGQNAQLAKEFYTKPLSVINEIFTKTGYEKGIDTVLIDAVSFDENGRIIYNDAFFKVHHLVETTQESKHLKDYSGFLTNLNLSNSNYDVKALWNNYDDYTKFKFTKALVNRFIEKAEHSTIPTYLRTEDQKFLSFLTDKFTVGNVDEATKSIKGINYRVIPEIFQQQYYSESYSKTKGLFEGFQNPFVFLRQLSSEISSTTDNEYKNRLLEIRDIIKNEYLNDNFVRDIVNYKDSGKTEGIYNEYTKTMFDPKNIENTIDKVQNRIEVLDKRIINLKNAITSYSGERITKLFNEEALGSRISSSIAIMPSEGSIINKMAFDYFLGNDRSGLNLFFRNGELRDIDEIGKNFAVYRKTMEHIYGDNVNLTIMKDRYSQVIEMIKNGKSSDEVAELLETFKGDFQNELNNIFGITLMNNRDFGKFTKNAKAMMDGNNGVVYGLLTRFPANFTSSHQMERFVSISDRQILNNEFLMQIFRTGTFDSMNDATNAMTIGFKTMLAMNGDFDGDKIIASLLGIKDFGNLKNAQLIAKKIKNKILDISNIQNAISQNDNFLDVLNNTTLTSGKHEGLRKSLIRYGIEQGMVNSKGEMLGDNTVELLRQKFFEEYKPQIYTINNYLAKFDFKMKDEIKGLSDNVQPNLKFKLFKGTADEIEVDSLSVSNIYDAINKSDVSNLKNLSNERKTEIIQELLSSDNLTDEEKKILSTFLNYQDEFGETFTTDNIIKAFKGKAIGIGKLDDSVLKRNYTANALTGIIHDAINKPISLAFSLSQESFLNDLINGSGRKHLDNLLPGLVGKEFTKEHIKQLSKAIKLLSNQEISGDIVENFISSKHGIELSADAIKESIRGLFDSFTDVGSKSKNISNLSLKNIMNLSKLFDEINVHSLNRDVDKIKEIKLTELFDLMFQKQEVIGDSANRNIAIKHSLEFLTEVVGVKKSKELNDLLIDVGSGRAQVHDLFSLAESMGYDLTKKTDNSDFLSTLSLWFSAHLSSIGREFGTTAKITKPEDISTTLSREDEGVASLINYPQKIYQRTKKALSEFFQQKTNDTIPVTQASDFVEEARTLSATTLDNMEQLDETVEQVRETVSDNITVDQSTNASTRHSISQDLDDIYSNTKKKIKRIKDNVSAGVNVGKTSTESTAKATSSTAQETTSTIADSTEKVAKKIKKANGKTLALSVGAGIIGSFLYLINKQRTIVHLETRGQINQNNKESVQKRLGQYQINTNIRDLF